MKHFNLLLALSLLFCQRAVLQAEEPAYLLKVPEAIAALKENPNDAKILLEYANANIRGFGRYLHTDLKRAEQLVKAFDAVLVALKPDEPEAIYIKSEALKLISHYKDQIVLVKKTRKELEVLLTKEPDDAYALSHYSDLVAFEIRTKAEENPKKAEAELAHCQEFLKALSGKTKEEQIKTWIALAVRNINDNTKKTLEFQFKLHSVIGQDAIPLGIDKWANGAAIVDAELRGKVVLLDFTAAWCGACTVNFPDLIRWEKEYADDGLMIIGITKLYNYKWEDENNLAVESEDKVTLKEELEMLEKFSQFHKLKHPLGVTNGNRLSKFYHVTGYPQYVLIDRQGKIQLNKLGFQESNIKALDAKIKELLAE